MNTNSLKLSPPWEIFYREIKCMFEEDPEVKIGIDTENRAVKLFVSNDDKAIALSKILPTKKEFGGVTVTISVVPANKENFYNAKVFEDAFSGNPVFDFAETLIPEGTNNPVTFVIFDKKVVQYYVDNPFALKGLCSTLYEDIAEDIFDTDGVFYSTNDE